MEAERRLESFVRVKSVVGPESSAQNQGSYTVRFANPVRHCQWTATQAAISAAGGAPAFFNVRPSQFDTREVFVFARLCSRERASSPP